MTHEFEDDDEEPVFLTHAESPYHRGRCREPTWTRVERNEPCGDWIVLDLTIAPDGRIVEAYFDGQGCTVSQAAASLLCETVEGRNLRDLAEFYPEQMLNLLGVRLTALRQRCGLLAFRALKAMLYEHENLE